MSYSRRFSRRVACHYKDSTKVTYPASKTGGTITVNFSGTVYEDVDVDIRVNTSSFDSSVSDCNKHINGLTASVGAMNAAQCVAIKKNADKVSDTIINGFFHVVRTDLSTQKAELEQTIEARLLLLRQQADSLRKKQEDMTHDYVRTTAKYQKIFDDLNNELSIRIHEVDQPIFKMVKEVDEQSDRMLHTDMIQTAVTMSKESSMLQAQITSATVKHHALEAMNKAQGFLVAKALSERTIQEAYIEGTGNDSYMIPVCYMQTESDDKLIQKECFLPEYYTMRDESLKQSLCNLLENIELDATPGNDENQIKSYVQSEIANHISGNDEHSARVRNMINIMLNK